MLDADYLFNAADDIVELYEQLNTFGINDICRRLVNADFQLTGSAEWQYYLLQQTGMSRAEINKKIAEITKKSEKEIKAIFEECSYRSYNADMSVYEKAGIKALPFAQSERMLQILDATYRATLGELHNLTQTTVNSSQELLIKTLNETQWKVSTGMQSKNQAIAEAIEKVAADGIDVMYGSGVKRSIESVVRMCVTTGINQACSQISLQNCEKMGTDLVLTTSHPGARIGEGYKGHVNWQGRVFSLSGESKKYPSFVQECGFGQVQGICGINCRHSFLPYIDGISHNPFERYDSEKEHNKYIKQQKQRKMERDIRTTKRQLQAMQKSMDSTAETDVKEVLQSRYDELAYKLQEQRKNYMKFCESNALVPQNERMKVARFSRSEAQKAVWGAKRYEKALKEGYGATIPKNWNELNTDNEDIVLTGTNPKYKWYAPITDPYRTNCVNASVAYEMRARGYKVTAGPSRRKIMSDPLGCWENAERINVNSNLYEEIMDYMKAKRIGTRIQVCMCLEDSDDGHAFVVEKLERGVRFIDPQAGTVYNKAKEQLRGCDCSETYFFRTDKLAISQKGISACVREEDI